MFMKEKRDTKQDKSDNQEINRGEEKVGRAYHQDDAYDISHVDRQEGAMHHGVLGGNFECEEDNETSTTSNEDTNK
jgi:hypothetical protein